MKLDPEERIIAAALDQAVLNPANERGAGAQIEFSREGAKGLPLLPADKELGAAELYSVGVSDRLTG